LASAAESPTYQDGTLADFPKIKRWRFRDLLRALSVSVAVTVLGACQSTGSGVLVEHTPSERAVLGATLEDRLLRVRPQQPIFAASPKVSSDELAVLVDFVRTLPSGRLIEAGNPIYFLEVKSKVEAYSKTHKSILYEVAIRRADNRSLVFQNSLSSNCLESEALYTYPIRCSLLRPMLLRRALEGL
jgi:hypothetical protein